MITLEAADLIQGDASVTSKVDYTINGVEEASNVVAIKALADGQLASSIGTLYTTPASTETIVKSITLVNTDSSARTVNLYLKRDGTNSRRIIPVDLSLEADGGSLILSSNGLQVFAADGSLQTSGGGVAAHAILDGSVHNDSVADTVTRGSIIYGNATPKWDELGLGAVGTFLRSNGTDIEWEGTDAFELNAAGIFIIPKQSMAKGSQHADQTIPTGAWTIIRLDTEDYDIQNELDVTEKSGAADASAANKLHDADGGFASGDVGKTVWNTTDDTYTTISGFVDSGELDLTDDIMADTETYIIYSSRFTVGVAGKYICSVCCNLKALADAQIMALNVYVNGSLAGQVYNSYTGAAAANSASALLPLSLSASDYLEIKVYHNSGVPKDTNGVTGLYVWVAYTRIA